jgi:cell division protein ZapE
MLIPDTYKEFLQKNKISLDQAQLYLLDILLNLENNLQQYNSLSILSKIFFYKKHQFPKGIYIYGEVGSGKSMLVRMFFNHIFIKKKIQFHYQKFMQIIHDLLKTYRKNSTQQHHITQVASYFANKYDLIYIDELEIIDIVDAMVIGKIFQELLKQNITIIITSNREPNNLYSNGLQRDEFMKFIDVIEKKLIIHQHQSNIDYRRTKKTNHKCYLYPLNDENNQLLINIFQQKTNHAALKTKILSINEREIICKKTYNNICWFEYHELFVNPLGTHDYAAIAEEFDYIFVANIPIFGYENNNEARRFIIFIDCLYEKNKILINTAMDSPENICNNHNIAFEFKRTISRLIEMQSIDYLTYKREEKEKKC